MPSEYAQAVQLTRDFLLDLSSGEQVTFEPEELRERAAALLQHFPQTALLTLFLAVLMFRPQGLMGKAQ